MRKYLKNSNSKEDSEQTHSIGCIPKLDMLAFSLLLAMRNKNVANSNEAESTYASPKTIAVVTVVDDVLHAHLPHPVTA